MPMSKYIGLVHAHLDHFLTDRSSVCTCVVQYDARVRASTPYDVRASFTDAIAIEN